MTRPMKWLETRAQASCHALKYHSSNPTCPIPTNKANKITQSYKPQTEKWGKFTQVFRYPPFSCTETEKWERENKRGKGRRREEKKTRK